MIGFYLNREWQLSSSPGEKIRLINNGKTLDSFDITRRLRSGDLPAESWVDTARSLGISDLDLADAVS